MNRRKFIKKAGIFVPAIVGLSRMARANPFLPLLTGSVAPPAGGYASGLKGLWHMDEGSGLSRADSVNSTTLTDNATVGSSTGILGNAASFGAGNASQYLSAVSNPNITCGADYSVGGWANLTEFTANHGIASKGADDAYEEFSIIYNGGGDNFRGFHRDLTVQVASSVTFTTSGWHFVALVYDGTAATFRIYVDGVVDTTPTVPGPNTTTTGILKFGRTKPVWMEGWLDNWFLYQQALTNAQLDAIYNGGTGLAGP